MAAMVGAIPATHPVAHVSTTGVRLRVRTYGLGTACFSNGVIFVSLTPGGPTRQTVSKDGVVCATLDATSVWRDPNGAPLGTLGVNSDGTTTYSCTGEAPQTVPASCTINCKSGMCPP